MSATKKRKKPSVVELAFRMLRAAEKPPRRPREPRAARPKEEPQRCEEYRRLVAARACKNCGRQKHSQAAHVPPDGKGIKRDDRLTFPLCTDGPGFRGCHQQFDNYELMPKPEAVRQGMRWAAETRAEIDAEGAWPKGLPKWKGRR